MSIKLKAKQKQVELFEKLPTWFTSEDKKLSCLQIVSEVKKVVPYLHLDKKETVEQMRANDNEFLDFWLEVESQIKKIQ